MTKRTTSSAWPILLGGWIGAVMQAVPAFATPPPLPPQAYEVRSENGACKAHADPEKGRITAYRLDPNGGKPIWTLDVYATAMSISDDCLSLVTSSLRGSSGFLGNGGPSDPVLTFYREGRWIRRLTLGEVYPDLNNVIQKYPGEFWSKLLSWRGSLIVIQTVDDRTLMFSAASGGKVE